MPKAPKAFGGQRRREYRGTKQQRGYGGEWERISKLKRQQDPVCEICRQALAVDVDHIKPFKGVNDPLRTQWSNLQSVCRSCHNAKTASQ
jgi:5-methylcytosine-specific restriction endonuclease McrA